MSVLWDLKSATVAEVRKELIEREEFDSAYTTVLSLLQSLRSKRWVTVQKAGRRHVYTPSVSLDGVRCEALHRCINRYFDGTREALLRYLVSDRATPPGTLWRLRAYLDERLTRPAAPASGPPGPRAAPE